MSYSNEIFKRLIEILLKTLYYLMIFYDCYFSIRSVSAQSLSVHNVPMLSHAIKVSTFLSIECIKLTFLLLMNAIAMLYWNNFLKKYKSAENRMQLPS